MTLEEEQKLQAEEESKLFMEHRMAKMEYDRAYINLRNAEGIAYINLRNAEGIAYIKMRNAEKALEACYEEGKRLREWSQEMRRDSRNE